MIENQPIGSMVKYLALDTPVVEIVVPTRDTKLNQPSKEKGGQNKPKRKQYMPMGNLV